MKVVKRMFSSFLSRLAVAMALTIVGVAMIPKAADAQICCNCAAYACGVIGDGYFTGAEATR